MSGGELGKALLAALEAFARDLGYAAVPDANGNPYASFRGEKPL